MTTTSIRSIISGVLVAALLVLLPGCASHESVLRTGKIIAGVAASSAAVMFITGVAMPNECITTWDFEDGSRDRDCYDDGTVFYITSGALAGAGLSAYLTSRLRAERMQNQFRDEAQAIAEELEAQLITLTALRSEIGVRADTTCATFKRDCTAPRACLLDFSDAACIDADARMAGHPVLDSWWRQLRELSWSMYALEQQVRTSQWVRGAQVQSDFDDAE